MNGLRIDLVRVHDVLDDDGPGAREHRVLVDRLWPRGVKKVRLRHDDWDKAAAPSPDLRRAFHSGELDFEEFSQHYRRELELSGAAEALRDRALEADTAHLVLLYAAKDTEHNHAQVLREALLDLEG